MNIEKGFVIELNLLNLNLELIVELFLVMIFVKNGILFVWKVYFDDKLHLMFHLKQGSNNNHSNNSIIVIKIIIVIILKERRVTNLASMK